MGSPNPATHLRSKKIFMKTNLAIHLLFLPSAFYNKYVRCWIKRIQGWNLILEFLSYALAKWTTGWNIKGRDYNGPGLISKIPPVLVAEPNKSLMDEDNHRIIGRRRIIPILCRIIHLRMGGLLNGRFLSFSNA